MLVSLAALGRLLGYDVVAASPEGYEADGVETVRDPREAVEGADVVVTDTWISMGQEHERVKRLNDLEPYRLDSALLSLAAPEAFVMHCLPAHPGEEITAELLYGERSAIWDEAENRLHVQKALARAAARRVARRPHQAGPIAARPVVTPRTPGSDPGQTPSRECRDFQTSGLRVHLSPVPLSMRALQPRCLARAWHRGASRRAGRRSRGRRSTAAGRCRG